MIRQLRQFIANETGYTVIQNAIDTNDSSQVVMIFERGGPAQGYPVNRVDAQVQIVTRAEDDFAANDMARNIYNRFRELFDITLPAGSGLSSGDYGLNEIRVARMAAVDRPAPMGPDEGGLYRYSANYVLTFSET